MDRMYTRVKLFDGHWSTGGRLEYREGDVRRNGGSDAGARPRRGPGLSRQARAHCCRLCSRFGFRPGCPHDRAEARFRIRSAFHRRGAPWRGEQCGRTARGALAPGWLHAVRDDIIEHHTQRKFSQSRIRLQHGFCADRSHCRRAIRSHGLPWPGRDDAGGVHHAG